MKTDLDCRDQDRSGTPKVKIGLSGKALPSIAAAATQRLRGQRSVIVMQAHTMATVLVLNDDSSLIGSWTMQRYGTGWIWDSAHYCDGKLEEIVLT